MRALAAAPRLAVLLATTAARSVASDDAPLDGLDPTISQVQTGGFWHRGKTEGLYRTVVQKRCSPEHCYDRLFIQWLATLVDSDGRPTGESSVVATRPVREVGDLTHLTGLRFIFGKVTRIEVHHEVADDLKWTRCLEPSADFTYVAVEKPCDKAAAHRPR